VIFDSLDSSFESFEAVSVDPLSEMARLRVRQAIDSGEEGSFEQAVESILCKNFDDHPARWKETTQQVMRGVVESVKHDADAEDRIRLASETAVLAVARRWGNVVSAGKASVLASREAAGLHGLDSLRAAQNAGLGAIEGVMRVGPVAYPVLRKELGPIVEGFEAFVKDRPSLRSASFEAAMSMESREGWLAPPLSAGAVEKDSQEAPPIEIPRANPSTSEPDSAPDTPAYPCEIAPTAPPAGWFKRLTARLSKIFSFGRSGGA
jgi:hypothetical protein